MFYCNTQSSERCPFLLIFSYSSSNSASPSNDLQEDLVGLKALLSLRKLTDTLLWSVLRTEPVGVLFLSQALGGSDILRCLPRRASLAPWLYTFADNAHYTKIVSLLSITFSRLLCVLTSYDGCCLLILGGQESALGLQCWWQRSAQTGMKFKWWVASSSNVHTSPFSSPSQNRTFLFMTSPHTLQSISV